MKHSTRRTFLGTAATGIAVVSLPNLIVGCDKQLIVPQPARPLPSAAPPVAPAPRGYFDSFGVSSALLSRVIDKGLSRGGDFCEVFVQHRVNHWLATEDGEVNSAYGDVALGAGVRVVKGDATGYAFCEDLREEALLAAAATAATVADGAAAVVPKPLSVSAIASKYVVEVPWAEVSVDKKLPLLVRTEATARKFDPRISKVKTWLEDETCHILVADSEGRLVEDEQPMTTLSVTCVAEKGGRTEIGYKSLAGRDGIGFYTPERLEGLGNTAANHAVILFDAVSPPPGEYPVVLAPGNSGILLHEAIGHGMEADFNRKGISIYADRIGKRVAPPLVTIVDDGTNPRMRGSINMDDEGEGAQRTVLVEGGILSSYLHDRISAKHYSAKRTGSGRRESFRFAPVPRMRNTYMLPGPHKAEEIIGSVKKGIYAEMFSNGQVQIGAGDFTFYLKHGRLIEDGKLTRVVKDANLIGNGPKVLETVDMVGDDLAMESGAGYCGKDGQRIPVGFGLPTVRAGAMSVGGKGA